MRERLPGRILLLGWVSLLADVSSEMVHPLLPLFVVGALGAPATALGGIEGVAHALVAVVNAISGWHSDRTRHRVALVRWGYGLPVLGKALLAAAGSVGVVLAARAIDRLGKGLRGSPRDAMIADAVPASERGRAFGVHRAMDTAGAVVGMLGAAGLMFVFGYGGEGATTASSARPYRVVFAIAAVAAFASLLLTLRLKEDAPHGTPAGARRAPPDEPAERFTGRFWLVLAMLAVFAVANSSDAFLLLRAAHVGLSPALVVLAYALSSIVHVVTAPGIGALSDRVGRWRMIGAGWALYALVYAGFAVTGAAGVWPLMALYGVFAALTEGVGRALVADHAPAGRRATAMGILHLTLGACVLSSNLLAGVLWDHVGPAAPFWFGAGAALTALGILAAARGRIS